MLMFGFWGFLLIMIRNFFDVGEIICGWRKIVFGFVFRLVFCVGVLFFDGILGRDLFFGGGVKFVLFGGCGFDDLVSGEFECWILVEVLFLEVFWWWMLLSILLLRFVLWLWFCDVVGEWVCVEEVFLEMFLLFFIVRVCVGFGFFWGVLLFNDEMFMSGIFSCCLMLRRE